MSLLAFVHAWDSEATCTVGEQCSSDDTGMLQKNARMAQVNEFSKANQTDGKYQKGADAKESKKFLCQCKQPNGNDNTMQCQGYYDFSKGIYPSSDFIDDGNCPTCCQCTSATTFPKEDRADFCHGGAQCGQC